jgi:hypothetical protein
VIWLPDLTQRSYSSAVSALATTCNAPGSRYSTLIKLRAFAVRDAVDTDASNRARHVRGNLACVLDSSRCALTVVSRQSRHRLVTYLTSHGARPGSANERSSDHPAGARCSFVLWIDGLWAPSTGFWDATMRGCAWIHRVGRRNTRRIPNPALRVCRQDLEHHLANCRTIAAVASLHVHATTRPGLEYGELHQRGYRRLACR